MVTVCALAAAAHASAAGLPISGGSEPEMGVCVKQSEGAAYSNSKCTKAATGSKAVYAWKTEIAKPGFAISARRVEFRSIEGTDFETDIRCKSASGKGHYYVFGQKGTVIALKGCEASVLEGEPVSGDPACSSEGAASGEITTETLGGELGISAADEGTKEGALGLDLDPEGSARVLVATCAGVTVTIYGDAIGLMKPAAKMTAKSKLTFATVELDAIEWQNPRQFRGRPRDTLELCDEFCSLAVIRGVFSIANEEAVEANPVA